MRTVLFLDQVQAGLGIKSDNTVSLQVKKGGYGSYNMFEKEFKEFDIHVVATIICGAEFYFDNEISNQEKISRLLNKIQAEVLICGPCYDYHNYAMMAINLAKYCSQNTECKVIVALNDKNNENLINENKNHIFLYKMPEKGGIGLRDSFKNLARSIELLYRNKSIDSNLFY